MQLSFGLGFINIASNAVTLVRCLLINATYGPEKYPQSPAAATKEVLVPPPTADIPDQPRARFWYRQVTGLVGLLFLAALLPGIMVNLNQSKVPGSQTDADMIANTRLVVNPS